MRSRCAVASSLGPVLFWASCLAQPGEVVITVDTTLAIPCDVDALTLAVTVDGLTETRDIDLETATLPGSISVLGTDENNDADISVTATATLGGEVVAVGSGQTTFEPGQRQHLAFSLDATCTTDAPCAASLTPRFSGLPTPIARRDCVDAYEVRPTLLSVLNACDLAQPVQAVTLVSANEDEVSSPLDPQMPFAFYFYNDLVEQIWIGDNGYITFGAEPPLATVSDVGEPRSLGEQGFPGPGIVAFWDQLVTNTKGVCLAVTGNAPDRILWVSWDQACFEGAPGEVCGDLDFGSLTFSIGLEETTDRIYLGYPEMVATGATEARTRGLTSVIGVATDESLGKTCPATECSEQGLCGNGEPCNYTEFSSLSDVGPLPSIEFVPR